MDTNTKNALILAASALAGTLAGRWAAPRIGAALGLTLGPWGSAAGAMIGGVIGVAVTKRMVGEIDLAALEGVDPQTALKSE